MCLLAQLCCENRKDSLLVQSCSSKNRVPYFRLFRNMINFRYKVKHFYEANDYSFKPKLLLKMTHRHVSISLVVLGESEGFVTSSFVLF